jgi:hypothetical protein
MKTAKPENHRTFSHLRWREHINFVSKSITGVGLTILMTSHFITASAQTYFPPDVDTKKCYLSSPEFDSWIHLTPPVIGDTLGPVYGEKTGIPYIFPADGPSFIKNHGGAPENCDFYKWGAQMFLWLTSSIENKTTKLSGPSNFANSPYVFNSEFFYRVSADKKQLLPQGVAEDAGRLKIRSTKSDEGTGQAGGSGVLLTQPESKITNGQSLTYYGIHVNRLYGYFLYEMKSGLLKPTQNQFPTTAQETCRIILTALTNGKTSTSLISLALFDLFCIKDPNITIPEADLELLALYALNDLALDEAAKKVIKALEAYEILEAIEAIEELNPAEALKALKALMDLETLGARSVTIPDLETAIDYLSMTMELKTSWVDASTLKHPEKYIQQKMNIPTYKKSSSKHWTENGTESKTLALVGMHVVGAVEGHPENIWVTIEHANNAPNAAFNYRNTQGEIVEVNKSDIGSDWLFSTGTPVSEVKELAHVCTSKTLPGCKNKKIGDIVSDPSNNKIGASQVTRLNPWGNVQSDDKYVVDQNTQLIALNRDVQKNIKSHVPDDPRQNYFVSGAVWTSNGSIPNNYEYNTNLNWRAGSITLANTTMETFHQNLDCFSCHQASKGNGGVSISHIYGGLSPTLPKNHP